MWTWDSGCEAEPIRTMRVWDSECGHGIVGGKQSQSELRESGTVSVGMG